VGFFVSYTKGPWTVSHGKIVGNGYNIASINASATTEGKANSCIMAASLDMFDALQKLEKEFGCRGDGWPDNRWDEARTAIAKATGQ